MKVFISGYGSLSSLGINSEEMYANMIEGRSNVQKMPWSNVVGLKTQLGAPVPAYDSKSIPRTVRRTMSKASEMSLLASLEALNCAGLSVEEFSLDQNQKNLICFGSTAASPLSLEEYFKKYYKVGGPKGQLSTSFFKVMNHSIPANVAIGLGFKGPLYSLSSACSTSAQALVVAYDLIRSGLYDKVLCGGADELHEFSAAIFDIALAASTKYNDSPQLASRPFDKNRDGLVTSEGAGVLLIESEKSLEQRGGSPKAEILGGAYYCDGEHMSQPNRNAMILTMDKALKQSGLTKKEIPYINAHATSTLLGDIEESHAIYEYFGKENTPHVSSFKGHLGHSLAACGALEAITCIKMMDGHKIIPTKNLDIVDDRCAPLGYIRELQDMKINTLLSNNFAFGGMNVSFVLKKY